MSKILVTGGAGFIGSHLCEALLKRGNEVFCLDNFFTGSKENVEWLSEQCSRFHILNTDVQNDYFFKTPVLDQIYNLACPASPIHYQKDSIYTIRTSILGAINALDVALRNPGCKVLQASTSEVYGDPAVHPQPEEYWGNVNPIGIRSCYDEGKRISETLFSDYRRQMGLDAKIVRIFNTYGPNMQENDGRVVSNFILQALKGEPITIYGDGSQTRSFCFVDDLVRGLISMMESEQPGPINLGNPKEYTILQLAQIIIKMTHSNSKIIREPLPKDDPTRRKPDTTKANKELSWFPLIDLENGLLKTIKYFRDRL